MLSIISPAKSLNFETPAPLPAATTPEFLENSAYLLAICKGLSPKQLQKLMNISDRLVELNYQRFQGFETQSPKQAIFAYDGDVYDNIDKASFSRQQIDFMQVHIRIISGLYGALRPLDYIRPYRLEMSTKLPSLKDLYSYWQGKITSYFNELLAKHNNKYLINLASTEYSAVINKKDLNYPMINIHFKEKRAGKLQTIGILAKKARGMMINFIIKHNIDTPNELKNFNAASYQFDELESSELNWCFVASNTN